MTGAVRGVVAVIAAILLLAGLPVVASAQAQGARDTFARPDSAMSLGVADTGQAWTAHAGTWGIDDGRAYASSSGYALATLDAGLDEAIVSAEVDAVDDEFWLVLRLSDSANYWRFGRWAGQAYQLQQIRDNGLGSPALTVSNEVTPAAGDVLDCRVTPTLLSCSVNGTEVVRTDDAFNASATRVGFAVYDPSQPSSARFDSLTVVTAPPLPTAPDLGLTLTTSTPSGRVGQPLSATITVANSGTAAATGVRLSSPLPAGSEVSTDASQGDCSQAAGVATCELGAIAAGADATVTVTVTPDATGELSFSASVTSDAADPTPHDSTVSRVVPILVDAEVVDTFARPDSATSLGAADTGQAWTTHAGVWGITGGQAYPTEAGYSMATVDAGLDETLVTVEVAKTAPEFWVILRAADGANYWRFGRWGSEAYTLQKIQGNGLGAPALTTLNTVEPADGDVIACRSTADVLACSITGTPVVRTTDAFNASATRAGLAAYDGGQPPAVRVESFVVADAPEPPPEPDLQVTMTASQPSAPVGTPVTFTTTVTNAGSGPATGVTLTTPLPPDASYGGASASSGSCEQEDDGVACALGDLAAGASATVTVTVTPTSAGVTRLESSAAFQGTDPTPADNVVAREVIALADGLGDAEVVDSFARPDSATSLGVADTGQPWTAHAGTWGITGGAAYVADGSYGLASVDAGLSETITTVRVSTVSSEFWVALRLSDSSNYWRFGRWHDETYQLQQIRENAVGTPAITTLAAVQPADGDVIECRSTAATLTCAVNGVDVVRTSDTFNRTATRVGLVAYQADGPSPARFDSISVTAAPPAAPEADLRATMTVDRPSAPVGTAVTYTLTVANVGTATAEGVEVHNPLPAHAEVDQVTPSQGDGCTIEVDAIHCPLGEIAAGAEATVAVTVTPTAAGSIINAATVTHSATDPTPDDNVATRTITALDDDFGDAEVVDTFARPDSATSLGTADTGQTWTAHAGAWGVSGGQAYLAGGGFGLASIDAGFPFGTYEVTVADASSGGWAIAFRVEDERNYYRVGPDPYGTGFYRVYKVRDGQVQELVYRIRRLDVTPQDGDRIRIVVRPDDGVYVAVNGQHVFDGGDQEGMYATGFGFLAQSNQPRFADLTIADVMDAGVMTDSFSRPDTNTTLGRPETGPRYNWFWFGQPWGITNGQAHNTSSVFAMAKVDTSSENTSFSITVAKTSPTFYALFRFENVERYYRFGSTDGGPYEVTKMVDYALADIPGGVTQHATVHPADGDRLTVRQYLDGRVETRVNGVLTHSFSDPTFAMRSTYIGLAADGSQARFDDLRVVPEDGDDPGTF